MCPDNLFRSWAERVGEVSTHVTFVLKVEQEGSSEGGEEEPAPPPNPGVEAEGTLSWAGLDISCLPFGSHSVPFCILHCDPGHWPLDYTKGLASGWIWVLRSTCMRLKRTSIIGKVFTSFALSVGPRNWLHHLTCLWLSLLPGGPPHAPPLPSPLSRLQVLIALGLPASGMWTVLMITPYLVCFLTVALLRCSWCCCLFPAGTFTDAFGSSKGIENHRLEIITLRIDFNKLHCSIIYMQWNSFIWRVQLDEFWCMYTVMSPTT